MATDNKSNSLSKDANSNVIQAATKVTMRDGTGTPIASPKVVSSSVITLVPPPNAIVLWFKPSAVVRVSDVVGVGTYFTKVADVWASVPVSGMAATYFLRDSGDVTLDFYYELIGS